MKVYLIRGEISVQGNVKTKLTLSTTRSAFAITVGSFMLLNYTVLQDFALFVKVLSRKCMACSSFFIEALFQLCIKLHLNVENQNSPTDDGI